MSDPWFCAWNHRFGFPASYTAFDLVTSGIDPETDLIIEAGFCLVRNGRVEDRHSIVLDWGQESTIDSQWLRARLKQTASRMEWRDGVRTPQFYPFDFDAVVREGMHPRLALTAFGNVLSEAQERGVCLVAHNGWWFDVPFLNSQTQKWLGLELDLDPGLFYDTAMIKKASLLGEFPRAEESLGDFWTRVAGIRGQASRWSLHDHCLPEYGLTRLYWLNSNRAGRADQEAYAVYLVMEEFRRRATLHNESQLV